MEILSKVFLDPSLCEGDVASPIFIVSTSWEDFIHQGMCFLSQVVLLVENVII